MSVSKESLPQFNDIQKALASKNPFRLTYVARKLDIRHIKYISEDDRRLLLQALFHDDMMSVAIEDEADLNFVVSLLKEHDRIEMLSLRLLTSDDFNHKLAPAIETSHVAELDLAPLKNFDPILRALKHNKTLRKLNLILNSKPNKFDSLVDAVSNENLESFAMTLYNRHELSEEEKNSMWAALKPVLLAHKSLKALELEIFNSKAYQELAEILAKNTTIQRLKLKVPESHISANDMTMLCNGLVNNSTLNHLSVLNLRYGAASVLFASLAHDRCQVSSIQMHYSEVTDEDVRQLNESLKTNTKLTELFIDDCQLHDKFLVLCEGLKHNKGIKHLRLKGDDLSDTQRVKAMCDMLMQNDSLTTLNLSACILNSTFFGVTVEQFHVIGEMLKKNKSLTDFTFTSNDIGDDGISIICEAMVHNTTLKKLHLGFACATVQTATGVKNLMVHNRTLRHLEVALNSGDTEGDSTLVIDLICEGIKHNDSMVNLEILKCARFGEKSVQKFIAALQDNYALDSIWFYPYFIGCTVNAAAQPLLRRNRQLKSSIKFLVAILSHNIARSSHALTILPREMWKKILSSITSPGMEPLDGLVTTIFNSYE